jgi:Tetratricopeptide repeat
MFPAPDSVKLNSPPAPVVILASMMGISAAAARPIEYARDVAPILDARCVTCHRPDGGGPFPLQTYAEARKHAKEITAVTARRYMPPWLPSPACTNFADARVLTTNEIAAFAGWEADGLIEGDPANRPNPPSWPGGWLLGTPDLVVTMTVPYELAPEGKDVYRNFVAPIPPHAKRFVRGIEFHPGNPRVVHHAFVNIDPTRGSRRRAEKESPPGFDGMQLPETAVMPGGQLLGWQPGKIPYLGSEDLGWELPADSDLVLQLHMHPSGRPETVQSAVGFYFTDRTPTNSPYRVELVRFDIDVPPGTDDYAVENSYVMPIDGTLLRISPHSHYVARRIQGFAEFPGGGRATLVDIPDWDFNWQGDYRFAEPVSLPKGTRLSMRFQFDNTTNNVRNPFNPPKRIVYGLQTTDEMAELWFQILPDHREDRAVLARDFLRYRREVLIESHRLRLKKNPGDGEAELMLGSALNALGRTNEGLPHLEAAARLRPNDDRVFYEIGFFHLGAGRYADAKPNFEKVVALNPKDSQAHGSLGIIAIVQGDYAGARRHLEEALRLNPEDTLAKTYLDKLAAAGK